MIYTFRSEQYQQMRDRLLPVRRYGSQTRYLAGTKVRVQRHVRTPTRTRKSRSVITACNYGFNLGLPTAVDPFRQESRTCERWQHGVPELVCSSPLFTALFIINLNFIPMAGHWRRPAVAVTPPLTRPGLQPFPNPIVCVLVLQ
jgi:hypothetical protein